MEKYITVLVIMVILIFSFCTFTVFDKTPAKVYAVTKNESIADKILTDSQKWQANGYFVYKLADTDKENAKKIPGCVIVKEYISPKDNNIEIRNPFLKEISSGNVKVTGIPYVID
jgi:hypothetical protein